MVAGQLWMLDDAVSNLADVRAAPQSRQGIAGQAERPQWIQSLADLQGIAGTFRKLRKRRSPPRV